MTTSDYKQATIATACWRAAQGELHQVMLSVAQVFMNRAQATEGDLYEESVKWLIDNPGEYPDPRDPQFQSLLSRLETVTSGLAKDVTGGALWFVPTSQLQNGALEGFTVTTTIGSLTFVK